MRASVREFAARFLATGRQRWELQRMPGVAGTLAYDPARKTWSAVLEFGGRKGAGDGETSARAVRAAEAMINQGV